MKAEVKPWTEYLDEVLERMNTKKQSNEEDDDKIYPHKQQAFHPTRQPNQRTGSRFTTTWRFKPSTTDSILT